MHTQSEQQAEQQLQQAALLIAEACDYPAIPAYAIAGSQESWEYEVSRTRAPTLIRLLPQLLVPLQSHFAAGVTQAGRGAGSERGQPSPI